MRSLRSRSLGVTARVSDALAALAIAEGARGGDRSVLAGVGVT